MSLRSPAFAPGLLHSIVLLPLCALVTHAILDSSSLFKPVPGLCPGSSDLSHSTALVGDFINSNLDSLTIVSVPK